MDWPLKIQIALQKKKNYEKIVSSEITSCKDKFEAQNEQTKGSSVLGESSPQSLEERILWVHQEHPDWSGNGIAKELSGYASRTTITNKIKELKICGRW